MQFRISCATRYRWADLREEDATEQLVYDRSTGATHLVDGLAQTIQSVLVASESSVSKVEILRAIGVTESDDSDEPVRQFVTELLEVMHRAELLERVSEGDQAPSPDPR